MHAGPAPGPPPRNTGPQRIPRPLDDPSCGFAGRVVAWSAADQPTSRRRDDARARDPRDPHDGDEELTTQESRAGRQRAAAAETDTKVGSARESVDIPSPETASAEIAVVGMAVMGSNLARNLGRHGYRVAVYDHWADRTVAMMEKNGDEGTFVPSGTVEDLARSLERPRRIILLVKAGEVTDQVIDTLLPHLEEGDIVVDGGNSFFEDTRRREAKLRELGFHFVGAGVSGGEVGALEGPSIMPGGSTESYEALGPMLEDISAHVDGEPCCTHIGPDGSGHFVKMVHNGIEYADIQFIGEAYELLSAAGFSHEEAAGVFEEWNTGDLDSYLIEITADVLRQIDAKTGEPLLDVIVDAAGMKGTGTWTVQTALDLATPVNTIAESVFARAVSSHTTLRRSAQRVLTGPGGTLEVEDRAAFVADLRDSLWASKVIAYAQGLDQIRMAGEEYGWDVDMAEVAKIWRAGCIIRAELLNRIRDEYAGGDLETLLEAPSVSDGLARCQDGWRRTIGRAVQAGVPVPGFSAAVAYYDMVRAPRVNAAMTQGLRDYFGAHTYRRTDAEGSFHTLWSGDRSEITVD
ncbi:NADP-dependent phosphogluconate dehydrogenase [Mobilicoccus caccae]|uniref:6-phosphogluconate dehydrogenase, decarboxylating n=1 Tax=Mobilicoccus caccae TaxID=1859295 RepID=A0ABQ6ILS7_9MICO|nr:NADP-dependent phosphogluconate dehydrogenase [Mobilicoccus caccae]GMA38147.1 6-phosphogluconate dehydrogenase, decarboxylating [Mobilicoccus caccae]